jgi:hypothetical protein
MAQSSPFSLSLSAESDQQIRSPLININSMCSLDLWQMQTTNNMPHTINSFALALALSTPLLPSLPSHLARQHLGEAMQGEGWTGGRMEEQHRQLE